MKIFLTEFEHKGKRYEGPSIIAENEEVAESTAQAKNLIIVGELDTLFAYGSEDSEEIVLH